MLVACLSKLVFSRRKKSSKSRTGSSLRLVRLEDRCLPSTFRVLNFEDNNPGSPVIPGSLRAAVMAANDNPGPDTIVIAKEPKNSLLTLADGELLISNNVTITGPGANFLTIDGNSTSRVFEVEAGLAVTIIGVTIEDGSAIQNGPTDDGGGVLNDGSRLTLSLDTIENNEASNGGGIAVLGGSLIMNRCTVENNTASGGGSVGMGGGIDLDGMSAVITKSTIEDNTANEGGGIWNDGSSATFSGDAFTSNMAKEDTTDAAQGGAIQNLGGIMTLTNCSIVKNQAEGNGDSAAVGNANGGGICILGGTVSINDGAITSNTAAGGANSSSGVGTGGGLFLLGGYVTIDGGKIVNNKAMGGYLSSDGLAAGGGIYSASNLTIANCIIQNNTAIAGDAQPSPSNSSNNSALGGGLFSAFSTTNSITACLFSGNSAKGGLNGIGTNVGLAEGGAIDNYGSTTIDSSTFKSNQALAGSFGTDAEGEDPLVDYSLGGAIANTAGILNIANCKFVSNSVMGGNHARVTGTDIVGAGGAEGGALFNGMGSAATIVGSSFNSNTAQGGNMDSGSGPICFTGEGMGGAISSGYGTATDPNVLNINGCTLFQNNALGGNGNSGATTTFGLAGAGVGGAIANYAGSQLTLQNSVLDFNKAEGGSNNMATGQSANNLGSGGAVFNFFGNYLSAGYGLLGESAVAIANCSITFNIAEGMDGNGDGGGIANVQDASTAVAGSTISQNQADDSSSYATNEGGGVYNDATSTLSLTNSQVTLNLAGGTGSDGGGVFSTPAFNRISTLIQGNSAAENSNVGP